MELLRSLAATTLLSFVGLLAVIAIEHVGPRECYSLRDRLPGVAMNLAGTFLSLALVWPINWMWMKIGVPAFLVLPLWRLLAPFGAVGFVIPIVALVAAADFLIYWRHRAEHAWFWPVHAVHHAPDQLHAANDIGHRCRSSSTFSS